MDCKKYNECEWIFSEKAAINAIELKREYQKKVLEEFNLNRPVKLSEYHPAIAFNGLSDRFEISKMTSLTTDKFNQQLAKELEPILCNDFGEISFVADDPFIAGKFDKGVLDDPTLFKRRLQIACDDLNELGGPFSILTNIMTDLFLPVNPLNHGPNVRYLFSSHHIKGVIFVHYGENEDQRRPMDAIDIFHEVGHQVLMYYLLADDIITSNPDALVYSGARRVLRPAYRSLHSAMALVYMLVAADGFFQSTKFNKERAFLKERIEIYRTSLGLNLASLRKECTFSEFGEVLMNEMELICNLGATI